MERYGELGSTVSFHATPVILPDEAGGHLVVCTPVNWIIALDPATGKERWRFDAQVNVKRAGARYNCRGIVAWRDPDAALDRACAWRLFMGTTDQRLVSIDARTGKPCVDFGQQGILNIRPMVRAAGPGSAFWGVQFVSPPVVLDGVVILGSTNNAKFRQASAPSGMIRAFDARTGRSRWTFDTLIRTPDGDYAATPAHVGGANAWGMLSIDSKRGLVFIPTSSPSPDFFGGRRPGDNRYANSVVALRAATGELVWHQQLVHHDVWDMGRACTAPVGGHNPGG